MTLPTSILPQKLREYLAARECVAFVGAGFCAPCGMPSWRGLLEDLVKEAAKSVTETRELAELKDCQDALSASFYPTAASGIKNLLSKEQLRRYLADAFDSGSKLQRIAADKQQRMLARMENLVLGPWAGIITTNYDTLIENGFDRFPQPRPPFRCDGSHHALGNVLCLPLGAGRFFVKLHGDTWADTQVLSTSDYVQAWMTSPRIQHFLTAVMLRYRLVFIGCSLEDAILQLRQRLWADFGKALPRAYGLLPDVPASRLRRRELKDDAGIESLLYSVENVLDRHAAVDDFLREARHCADFGQSESQCGTLNAIKTRTLPERLEAVGAINRHLIAVLNLQDLGRLKYAYLFDPDFEQVRQGKSKHVLSTLSEGERLYRMLFLVSLQLVEEHVDEQAKYFQLSSELRNHLVANLLVEGT